MLTTPKERRKKQTSFFDWKETLIGGETATN
jgi:hypothetical protein